MPPTEGLSTLFQSRPLPPDVLPPDAVAAIFLTLVLMRVVGGPVVYAIARGRAQGTEVWWGFFGTATPLIALVLLFVLHGSKSTAPGATWNPWILCPLCGAPRGYTTLPCPSCGRPLPVMPGYAPPPLAPPAPPTKARLVTGGQVVGAIFFMTLLANFAAILVLFPLISGSPDPEGMTVALAGQAWFILLLLVVQDSVMTGLALDQALFRNRLSRAEMGLGAPRPPSSWAKSVGVGVGAGAFTFGLSTLFLLLLVRMMTSAGLGDPTTTPSPTSPQIGSVSDYQFWLVAGVVVAPLAEELFFRGYALGGFLKRQQVNRGLILTSVLFAAIHLDPVAFVPLMVAGFVLGTLMVETGSLAAPIAAHATNNFIAMTLTFLGY